MQKKAYEDLVAEVQELRAQLEEAQETLDAIRRGEVDGLVVSTPKGEQVYTISGAERPYRALIEDMREGAVMLSDDNTVLYCNSGFAKMMKRTCEKIVGVKIESMICPTYIPALTELLTLSRAQKGAVAKEVTLQAKEDVLVPTLMSVNSLQSDTLKNTFLVVTDLSEHMEEEVKRYTTELELAQIALSESEQRWATTLASIGDAVIATDKLGNIKFMNGAAEELTGWTLSEASKRSVQEIFKIVNEFSRKTVDDPVSKVLKTGIVCGLANHTILIRKDKSEIAIDDSGAPIKDKEGTSNGVVLIFRDITERRKAEGALRDAEKLLSAVTNGSSDAIYVKDCQSRWLFANPALEKIVGKPSAEVLGRNDAEIYGNNEASKAIIENDRRIMDSGKPETVEECVQYPDGQHSFISVKAPRFDENGQVIGLIGISHDITERKKVEEALSRINEELEERVQKRTLEVSSERQRLYRVLETLPAYVVLLDKDYRMPFANKVFRETFGESHGRRCHEYLFGRDSECENCETYKVLKTNKPQHWEWTGPNKHDYEIYDYPFVETDGSTLILEMGIDVTERNKAEREAQDAAKKLKDAERLATIGATAGMVGHDIRNPLQAISGDLYLAKEGLASCPDNEGKEEALESITEIEKNIDYINKIVQDLQDYARPLNPNPGEVDLKLIIEKLLEKNGLPENVKVSVEIDDDARKFVADSDYLNRIFYNLVTNAVQAMPKDGKLTIKAHKDKKDVVICVKDTGVGIPKEIQGKMFTPMFTTKAKGQGFGLPVVKRMTESLGGTVTFESEEGKGTTFEVRLPSQNVKS